MHPNYLNPCPPPPTSVYFLFAFIFSHCWFQSSICTSVIIRFCSSHVSVCPLIFVLEFDIVVRLLLSITGHDKENITLDFLCAFKLDNNFNKYIALLQSRERKTKLLEYFHAQLKRAHNITLVVIIRCFFQFEMFTLRDFFKGCLSSPVSPVNFELSFEDI